MASKQIQFQDMEQVREQFTLNPIKNKDGVRQGVINKFGNSEPASYRGEKGESPFKEMIAKLSRGLMLPIALLPIAGLFLGIGSAIVTQAQNNGIAGLEIFGKVLKVPGDAIFGNLPVLFCIAIAITFANDKGVAGLAGIVGWITFCAFQSALIQQTDIKDAAGNVLYSNYQFLFYSFVQGSDSIWTPEIFNTVFTSNMGIRSLQTSIVGGMTIGGVTAFLYNRFKTIQFPQILGFFQGERFIPILMFVVSLVISLLFSIVWPVFGFALYKFGTVAGQAPYGLNSLVFGYVERALVPTGLHHAFYSPLWYTAAGGSMNLATAPMEVWVDGSFKACTDYSTWQAFAVAQGLTRTDWNIQGDQNCWMFIYSIAGKTVNLEGGIKYTITFDTFKQISMHDSTYIAGVNAGQYMQGKFPFMLLGLPFAAFGIVMAAPKGDGRKAATSAVAGSALTCFLTGITEPLEFTFLFLAPALYFGLHAALCAISFWLMNLFGAHCGLTFSGGAIDYVIYGILPDAMGDGTKCWLALVIGAGLSIVYFFGFWGIIVRSDIKTPGREGASNKLMTRADYNAAKAGGSSSSSSSSSAAPASSSADASNVNSDSGDGIDVSKLSADQRQAYEVIYAYGGKKNIRSIEACITKLRVDVDKATLVDDKKLVELGAHGVVHPSNKSVYAVFGTKADIIKSLMQDLLDKMN